ncbi:MAG TPA: hypothetical protein DEF00_04785 [Candidatus Taylorbacteria bacterium]|nr:hypothetical protein [Candidatus Taylorbacteria bacterium]
MMFPAFLKKCYAVERIECFDMKTKNSQQLLRSATLALRAVLEKKPNLAQKLTPCINPPYRVFSRRGIFNVCLIAYFGSLRQGLVVFTRPNGKATLGIFRSYLQANGSCRDVLVGKGHRLSRCVRVWVTALCSHGGWVNFLRKFERV